MKHAILIVATLLHAPLAIVSAVAAPVDTEAERPNIIFVMADDLGWGDIGFNRNTIVFFTRDNGPVDAATKKGIASAGPFRGHEHTMYEGGLRVPSLVEWPGHITAGTTSDMMCATVDYFPTVVELTGASLGKKANRPIDGLSIM